MEIRAAESFNLYVNEQHKKCPLIKQGKLELCWTKFTTRHQIQVVIHSSFNPFHMPVVSFHTP